MFYEDNIVGAETKLFFKYFFGKNQTEDTEATMGVLNGRCS